MACVDPGVVLGGRSRRLAERRVGGLGEARDDHGAEHCRRHHVEGGSHRAAGDGDQPGRQEGRETAEDGHRQAVADAHPSGAAAGGEYL